MLFEIMSGNLEYVKELIDMQDNIFDIDDFLPNAEDNWETPLLYAMNYNHVDLVQFFLERGANPNQPSKNGTSPLYLAIHNYQLKNTDLLIRFGAETKNIKDNKKKVTIYDIFDRRPSLDEERMRPVKKMLLEKYLKELDDRDQKKLKSERMLFLFK